MSWDFPESIGSGTSTPGDADSNRDRNLHAQRQRLRSVHRYPSICRSRTGSWILPPVDARSLQGRTHGQGRFAPLRDGPTGPPLTASLHGPLHGQNTGQGTPCPRRHAPDNRRPTRNLSPGPTAGTRTTDPRHDPKLAQNCYTYSQDGPATPGRAHAPSARAHAHQHRPPRSIDHVPQPATGP